MTDLSAAAAQAARRDDDALVAARAEARALGRRHAQMAARRRRQPGSRDGLHSGARLAARFASRRRPGARSIARSARRGTRASTATSRRPRSWGRSCSQPRELARRPRSRTSCSWAWASRSRTTATCCPSCICSSTTRRSVLSRRRVTISTAGVVPQMLKLANECNVALAVSLHAPTDELRDKLVPINKVHPIAELLDACWKYAEGQASRSITFEYVLLDGVNDSVAQARAAREAPAREARESQFDSVQCLSRIRVPLLAAADDRRVLADAAKRRADCDDSPPARRRHRGCVRAARRPRARPAAGASG